jgi:N-acetylmuramoyl-L-alanine amidase
MPRNGTEKDKVIYKIPLILFLLLLMGCSRSPNLIEVEEISVVEVPVRPFQNVRPVQSSKNVTITLDAGHGGEDFGAHSNTTPKYHEKNLNLVISKMVKTFLDQQGFKTEMTRFNDTFVSLDNRAKFANVQKTTLFVSLHFNSAPSKEADGIEVYYYKSLQNKERTENSRLLATAILEQAVEKTQAKSRGAKHGDFAVIRQTTMPAVLVEGGFLTNDTEMNKIKDPAYLKQLAWGIALGIQNYVAQMK